MLLLLIILLSYSMCPIVCIILYNCITFFIMYVYAANKLN